MSNFVRNIYYTMAAYNCEFEDWAIKILQERINDESIWK